jgi:hypothetical protein
MNKTILIIISLVALALVTGVFWYLQARDSKFPLIYNPAGFVSPDEIRKIEQLVRDQGERYVVSINIVNTNNAGSTTGHGSHRPQSGRKYDISRTKDGWKIDSVSEWKK